MIRLVMIHFMTAACLILASPLATATPPDDAQIDQLLAVMRARQTFEAIIPQVQASQRQIVEQITAGRTLTADQRQRLDRIAYEANARMLGRLSWHRMQPLYREVYRQTFSDDDMRAMIGFYSSPAGQNLLDKMPQLQRHTQLATQEVLLPMLAQMQRDLEDEVIGIAQGAASDPP